MNLALYRINRWLARRYDFLRDVCFYLSLGYGLRRAWATASKVLK